MKEKAILVYGMLAAEGYLTFNSFEDVHASCTDEEMKEAAEKYDAIVFNGNVSVSNNAIINCPIFATGMIVARGAESDKLS